MAVQVAERKSPLVREPLVAYKVHTGESEFILKALQGIEPSLSHNSLHCSADQTRGGIKTFKTEVAGVLNVLAQKDDHPIRLSDPQGAQ